MEAAINPLRIDDKPNGDTCYLVRSVLVFMAEAFDALENADDVLSNGAMTGAARIGEYVHRGFVGSGARRE